MPSRPRWIRWLPAWLLLAVLPAAAEEARPPPPGSTSLVSLAPASFAVLNLPPGAGADEPSPVVVILPDADGPGPRSATYAERLLESGIAVLEPDFVGALPEDAPAAPPVRQLELLLQAIAAEARLDARHVVVLGLGTGARTALLGLAAGAPAAIALLYPGCDAALAEAARRAPAAMRILLLHGDADPANAPAACASLAQAFPAPGAVSHRVLAGASYGWDAYSLVRPGGAAWLPHPAGRGRAWSRPDPVRTEVAADRVLGFVLAALRRD